MPDAGSEADGVTVHIPVAVLNQVRADGFDWQVPGLREELATALIRSLPKQLRRSFIPAPDRAKAVLARIAPSERALVEALGSELHRETGVVVPVESWRPEEVPAHLRMTFEVVGDGRCEAEVGRRRGHVHGDRWSEASSPVERNELGARHLASGGNLTASRQRQREDSPRLGRRQRTVGVAVEVVEQLAQEAVPLAGGHGLDAQHRTTELQVHGGQEHGQ